MQSITELVTLIGSMFFKPEIEKIQLQKVFPKLDYSEDVEMEIIVKKPHNNDNIYPDLELGFGPIIEIMYNKVIIDTTLIHQYKRNIQNCNSFLETMDYMSKRKNIKVALVTNELYVYWFTSVDKKAASNIDMDMDMDYYCDMV